MISRADLDEAMTAQFEAGKHVGQELAVLWLLDQSARRNDPSLAHVAIDLSSAMSIRRRRGMKCTGSV